MGYHLILEFLWTVEIKRRQEWRKKKEGKKGEKQKAES